MSAYHVYGPFGSPAPSEAKDCGEMILQTIKDHPLITTIIIVACTALAITLFSILPILFPTSLAILALSGVGGTMSMIFGSILISYSVRSLLS